MNASPEIMNEIFDFSKNFANELRCGNCLSRSSIHSAIVCIGVSTPPPPTPSPLPSKTLPPLFLAKPPPPPPPSLNLQTLQAPLFRPSLLYVNSPPSKSWIFQWKPKIVKFFILKPILSFKSNQILSYNFYLISVLFFWCKPWRNIMT